MAKRNRCAGLCWLIEIDRKFDRVTRRSICLSSSFPELTILPSESVNFGNKSDLLSDRAANSRNGFTIVVAVGSSGSAASLCRSDQSAIVKFSTPSMSCDPPKFDAPLFEPYEYSARSQEAHIVVGLFLIAEVSGAPLSLVANVGLMFKSWKFPSF